MRPTGVVLIALYHFLTALVLVLLAISLVVGGSLLGAMFGGMSAHPMGGMGLGMIFGVFGAIFLLFFAAIAALVGYGLWTLREWARLFAIVLAALSLLIALPGLLMLGLHLHLFYGTYRLFRIVVSVLIIWYLMQPHIRDLFRRVTPAAPAA